MLTAEDITKLATRKGVRRIAVENFLCSLGTEGSVVYAKMNLDADARSYKWSAATVAAIKTGIDKFYK